MIKYFRESFRRKASRRKFRVYKHTINEYDFPGIGEFRYASWDNPLHRGKSVSIDECQFYGQFIREGDLAVDIGANIGDTTVPMALAAGKTGLVLAFECNPVIYPILEVNSKLNPQKTSIKPYPYAISETEEEFYYNSSEASLGNGGISKHKVNEHGRFSLDQKVQSVNLIKILDEHHGEWLSRLSFIKTDTEGHDLIILKSLTPLLRKYQPTIVAECFVRATRDERKELFDLMTGLGYFLFHVDTFEKTETRKALSLEDMYRMKYFDFLAITTP